MVLVLHVQLATSFIMSLGLQVFGSTYGTLKRRFRQRCQCYAILVRTYDNQNTRNRKLRLNSTLPCVESQANLVPTQTLRRYPAERLTLRRASTNRILSEM